MYLGNQPALSYTSFAKQDFTTSATTSYTLDNPVTNENEIALFINFVRQEPTTAYTASGTSLTLTSATSASDDMYCVFLGKAVQTVNPPNGSVGASQLADDAVTTAKILDANVSLAKLSATGTKDSTTFLRGDNTFDTPPLGGITEADQWRINADSNTGSNTFVTANWERNDTSGFSKIGTGLSESSGVFSFASTGIYLITFYAQFEMEAGDGAAEFIMHKTTDNSTYAEAALALAGNDATSGGAVGTAANSFMFDVTDTSTHKFKFKTGSMGGSTFLLARTNYNATGFTMTRLGDT